MWLSQKNSLHKKKLLLKHYSLCLNSLTKLESVLHNIADGSSQEKIALAERIILQYNQLQYSISQCTDLIKPEQRAQYDNIGGKLIQVLNELFFHYWKERDATHLLNILVALASLDRVADTEMLIRKQIVSPLLQDIINEPSLQRNSDGLQSIYAKILSLLETNLKLLLIVMDNTQLSFLSKRYRFIVNCFWCEVENKLEVNLASIFAPGNPKVFYYRYNESMQFLNRLESYCSNKEDITLLHNTKEYKSFIKRWNLPVYFQIRFQEIAGNAIFINVNLFN